MPYQIKLKDKDNCYEQEQNTHINRPLGKDSPKGFVERYLVIAIDNQGSGDLSRLSYTAWESSAWKLGYIASGAPVIGGLKTPSPPKAIERNNPP